MHLDRPEMPSYLNDHTVPIHSHSPGVVHLDHENRYVTGSAKVNDHIPFHPRSYKPNDSLDGSSANSTHTSDASESRFEMDGDRSAATTMSATLPGEYRGDVESDVKKPSLATTKELPNGNTHTLVDRTARPPQPLKNGIVDGNPTAGASKDAQERLSSGSMNGSILGDSYINYTRRSDGGPVENGAVRSAVASSNGPAPAAVNPSLPTTASPSPDLSNRTATSPHRFSSPPIYQGGATQSTSAPGMLHPPPQPGLKHRHTLEVPKPSAPSRSSRDGADTAYASGRFSPTITNTPAGARRTSLSLMRRNTRSLQLDAPRDEIVPDEDALRWAEAYRQKRASKRKRLEQEDDDRVLVGTKVDENHANWVTAYNMLTGIRVSVSRTNAKLDRTLTDADFHAKQKSTFDIAGNELVPSAKYDFKFKDYAPWVFRHLRALFRLDPADYLMSLTGKYILSELGSPGKSGSFFYFSRDYKYIIKTIHHGEHKFLRKILKDYYQHVTDNPNTLLSQFYGLHRVKMPYGKKIHFVVMNNLFPPHKDIHQTYDLKGSTIGRDYQEADMGKNPRATLKDLNWMRRQQHLELGLQKKRLFLDQLHKDVRLLQRLHIMDYSLLIGIHDLQKGNEENLRDKTLKVFNPGGERPAPDDYEPHSVLMRTPSKLESQRKARELRQMLKAERPIPMGETSSKMPDELEGLAKDSIFYKDDGGFQATHENNTPGEEVYYLGVIDCLTHYGVVKKLEHFWKGLSNDRHQISALPPQEYGERFLNFMSGITMSPEEAKREGEERARVAAEEAAAEAAASSEQEPGQERVGSWSNSGRRKPTGSNIPPAPTYKPPPPPSQVTSGMRSPEAEAVIRRAEWEAQKSPMREEDVPERVLRATTVTAGVIVPTTASANATSTTLRDAKTATPNNPHPEWRESAVQVTLPVVDEANEASSTGERSRVSYLSNRTMESDGRPLTPAKDGQEFDAGFGNPVLSHTTRKGAGPPTPPKSSYLKPESADSGYGVTTNTTGRARSGTTGTGGSGSKVTTQLSRESLDKALPPLPKVDGTA